MPDKPLKFFINRTRNDGGPSIFGCRLKEAMIACNHKWATINPDISFIFSAGLFRPFSKNIVRLDGLYFDLNNTRYNCDKLNRKIFRAYRRADGVIFQSEFDYELFCKFAFKPKCQYTIIPNGTPESFSPNGERKKYNYEKTIICSSKWRAHKRVDCIIKGFLEYGDPSTGLVIIGDGINGKIQHPNIEYTGRIPPEDLPRYLRGADGFVHLSWLDHCPNTVVEALSCGLPVLCTDNGGTKELVGSNGIIMQCEDKYDFTKVDLYNPPKCDPKVVASGIDQILKWDTHMNAEHLSISSISERYVEFARSL